MHIDALRENCAKRENLVAESTAIVLAARRRDNFTRMKMTRSELQTSVLQGVKNEAYMLVPALELAPAPRKSIGSERGTS